MAISDRIKKLIAILRDEDLDEIEVKTWFTGIRVARRRSVSPEAQAEPDREETEPALTAEAQVPEQAASQAETVPPPAEEEFEKIVSPMVGTFFRSAGPEMDPFISEGSLVETGQVLCIIEAMKLMNEIEAEKSGVIRKILVEDSQPVEFGQPLFLVESA